MKIRLRFRWVMVAALVALAVLAVMVFKRFSSSRATVLLPGGVRLDYLGMAWNGEPFTTDVPWQRALRRVLPAALASKLPQAFTAGGNYDNTNTIAIWYTLTDATGANVSASPWQWYLAVGDDGFTFPLSGGGGSSTVGTRMYHHSDLQAYPRRQKDFELRFLDGEYRTVASIRIPNPNHGPFPVWQPEPLPLLRTNGPMVVKLERLAEGKWEASRWINADWKIVAAEPAWLTAQPVYQIYEDATGNQGGRLAFTEPAWKLVLPFHRQGWTNFDDNEKFRLADLALPAAGQLQLLQTNFTCSGAGFTVLTLSAAGIVSITNGTNFGFTAAQPSSTWSTSSDGQTRLEKIGSASPFFLIDVDRVPADAELRYRLIGADGREIPMQNNGWNGRDGGGRRYQQRFNLTNAVKTISLEVIVSRPRRFEFLVNPADVERLVKTDK